MGGKKRKVKRRRRGYRKSSRRKRRKWRDKDNRGGYRILFWVVKPCEN